MACSGALTSLVLTAAGSYITNGGASSIFGSAPISGTGIGIPNGLSTLSSSISSISSQSWFGDLQSTLGSMGNSVIGFTDSMKGSWANLVGSGGNLFYDAIGSFGPSTSNLFSTVVGNTFTTALNTGTDWARSSLGGNIGGALTSGITGDPKIFGSIMSTASSFVGSSNQFINAATNGNFSLGSTFTSMNNAITGSFDGVSKWASGLGDDISKLGTTVDWSNLSNLGSPGQLIQNISNSAGGVIGPLADKISSTVSLDVNTAKQLGANLVKTVASGNNTFSLNDVGLNVNSLAVIGSNLPSTVQSQIYKALGDLTPTEVTQVKSVLNNTQSAVVGGQDLLNPQKLLNKSFMTLTTPLRTGSVGFRAIYENESGSVNPEVDALGENLKGILPDDQAAANGALSRSLLQVSGISNSSTDVLADTVANLESLKDLPLIENQTEYVPEDVAQYWKDYYGTQDGIQLATGTDGQYKLSDVIGFSAGINSSEQLSTNAQLFQQLQDNGAFDILTNDDGSSSANTGIYYVIQYFCDGTYGPTENPPLSGNFEVVIPAGVWGEGTYTGSTATEAFEDAWNNGICPAMVTVMETIYNDNVEAQEATANSDTWTTQLGREYLNRQKMDFDATTVQAQDTTAISLAQNLHVYGQDTADGGAAEILERIVDTSTLGGQATIAAMREGRNLARLAEAQVGVSTPINTDGITEPATLSSGQYTEAEANAQVIRS